MPDNRMIIKIFLLLGIHILFAPIMLSQDSIFFRSNIPVSAKVIEVNNTQVKYYRDGNTSGPLYVISKNSVAFIKYADNYIDSFSVIIVSNKTYPKLDIKHGTVYSLNKKVSNAALLELLEDIEDTLIQNKLVDEFTLMKRYQKKHYTNNLIAMLAFGGSAFYGFIGYSLKVPEFGIGAVVAGVVVLIPAIILSLKNKKKYLLQQKLLVDHYNQLK